MVSSWKPDKSPSCSCRRAYAGPAACETAAATSNSTGTTVSAARVSRQFVTAIRTTISTTWKMPRMICETAFSLKVATDSVSLVTRLSSWPTGWRSKKLSESRCMVANMSRCRFMVADVASRVIRNSEKPASRA
ncbi:hypothetical protein SDC9_170907 [bioreactor metagenome]|uniref:Uncharacterized protein n=1 Tax=bioreactor metagenome TaxID=1076179 RepID=A0A645GCL2_9ZZZZ